jgi:hypothetical protein
VTGEGEEAARETGAARDEVREGVDVVASDVAAVSLHLKMAFARRAAEFVVEHDDESATRAVAVDAADEGTKERVCCVLSGGHLDGHVNRCHSRNQGQAEGTMSTVMAGQAVRPVCPRCSRPVRSGVELQAGLRDLANVLLAAEAYGNSTDPREQALHGTVLTVGRQVLEQLEAELQGAHRCGDCDARSDGTKLLACWSERPMTHWGCGEGVLGVRRFGLAPEATPTRPESWRW